MSRLSPDDIGKQLAVGVCIGSGCLSLDMCPLRNPWDELSEEGAGPRLLEADWKSY